MAKADLPEDHLSDYERAVCYYTLPRMRHPLTFGLIVAYAICVFEAAAAVIYGFLWENDTVWNVGVYALGGMIVFGLVVFFIRALIDDVRKRKLLLHARKIHAAPQNLSDLPDPFQNHILLRRPFAISSELYACTETDDTIRYIVESALDEGWWKVKTPQDSLVCEIRVLQGPGSFFFGQELPKCVGIFKEGQEIAQICRRFSFDAVKGAIQREKLGKPALTLRQAGLYLEERLVGRLYHLRNSYYLDVEADHFDETVLAYFVSVT